jgi:hypothetical protein
MTFANEAMSVTVAVARLVGVHLQQTALRLVRSIQTAARLNAVPLAIARQVRSVEYARLLCSALVESLKEMFAMAESNA